MAASPATKISRKIRLNLSSSLISGLHSRQRAAVAGAAPEAADAALAGSLGRYFSGNRIGSHSGWDDRLAINAVRNAGSRALARQRSMNWRRNGDSDFSHGSTSA